MQCAFWQNSKRYVIHMEELKSTTEGERMHSVAGITFGMA